MPTSFYIVDGGCEDPFVQLEEYDALLCEWLREVLAENQQSDARKSLRAISKEAGIAAPDLSRARAFKRNVSKEMLVGVARVLGIKMSAVFDRLSKIADRYERRELRLKVRLPDITVLPEHEETTRAVANAVASKSPATKTSRSKPAPKAPPLPTSDGPYPRKS